MYRNPLLTEFVGKACGHVNQCHSRLRDLSEVNSKSMQIRIFSRRTCQTTVTLIFYWDPLLITRLYKSKESFVRIFTYIKLVRFLDNFACFRNSSNDSVGLVRFLFHRNLFFLTTLLFSCIALESVPVVFLYGTTRLALLLNELIV